MKRRCRKVSALFLVVALLVSFIPTVAYSDDGGTESNAAPFPLTRTDDKVTVGAGNGIEVKLFDYGSAVNDNGLDGYFEFRGGCSDNIQLPDGSWEHAGRNEVWDGDGFKSNRVNVTPNLVNGYPVIDLSRAREAGHDIDDQSIGYLFGAGGKGVTAYDANNTLLQHDETTGHYFYNSVDNAVDFDISSGQFYVRNYTERGSSTAATGENCNDFLPFTYRVSEENLTHKQTSSGVVYDYESVTEMNYWFGMTIEFDFWMPEEGKFNGEDMVFNFSGDDDVWVFVDGKLALDLGGTHGVANGSINFATGEIAQYLNWKGANASSADTSYPTTLEAYGINLEPNSKHTLKFFYLERGSGTSNCSIDFNMPVIPSGDFIVAKQVSGAASVVTQAYDADYEFALYKIDTEQGFTAVDGASYAIADLKGNVIANSEATTDADGKFTLKAGQMAIFSLDSDDAGKYFVKESESEIVRSISNTVNGVPSGIAGGAESAVFEVGPDKGESTVMYTNVLESGSITISKSVEGKNADSFAVGSFEFEIKDAEGTLVGTVNLPQEGLNGAKIWSATVDHLLAGTYYVEEIAQHGDGYGYSWESVTYSDECVTISKENLNPTVNVVNQYRYTPDMTPAVAYKVWDDADNQDGIRPDSVRFALYAGATKIGEVDLSAQDGADPNKYSAAFEYDKYLGEPSVEEIGYTVGNEYHAFSDELKTVPGYTREINGLTITNRHVPEEIEAITVTKHWADGSEWGVRAVTVRIFAEGQEVNSAVIDGTLSDNWSVRFTADSEGKPLPKYKNGKEIAYSVSEDDLGTWWYYDVVKNGNDFIVTNYYSEFDPITVSGSVKKIWEDDGNEAGLRPVSIAVNLVKDNVVVDSIVLSEENAWEYVWTDLQLGAVYTVSEENVPSGYTSSVEAEGNSFVITNTYTAEQDPPVVDTDIADIIVDIEDTDVPKADVPVTDIPKTSDESSTVLWFMMFLLSGVGCFLLRKKRVKE